MNRGYEMTNQLADYTELAIPAGWIDETEEMFDPGEGIDIMRKAGNLTATVRSARGSEKWGTEFMGWITIPMSVYAYGGGVVRLALIEGNDWDSVVAKTQSELARISALNRDELKQLFIDSWNAKKK